MNEAGKKLIPPPPPNKESLMEFESPSKTFDHILILFKEIEETILVVILRKKIEPPSLTLKFCPPWTYWKKKLVPSLTSPKKLAPPHKQVAPLS